MSKTLSCSVGATKTMSRLRSCLLANGGALTQRQLTTLGEQVVQKGFERVNGVGRVALGGTVTREIQIRVDPAA